MDLAKLVNNNWVDSFNPTNGFGEYKDDAIQLLKALVEILDKNEIEYFLISGTLLGYQRHKDFIPWDDDMDIIVSNKFVDLFFKLVREYPDFCFLQYYPKYVYRFNFKNKIFKQKTGNYWPFIDIFVYNVDGEKINFYKRDWDYNEFFPKKLDLFNGILVSIPKNPDYFLKINYGDNFMNIYRSSNNSHRLERKDKMTISISANEYNHKIVNPINHLNM